MVAQIADKRRWLLVGLVFVAIAVWKKNHTAQAPEALAEPAAPEAEAQV